MFFKISVFIVLLLSIWQVSYRSTLAAIVTRPILDGESYKAFLNETQALFLWAGLFLLLTCFFSAHQADKKDFAASAYHWIGSFVLILSICAGLVLIVNPEGRFPWNQRNSYTAVAAQSIKANLYQKRRKTPDIVLLGSSISFTTPANYFKKKWGANTFNMSLNGGGPADIIRSLNYMIQQGPTGKVPATILVEVLSPGLRVGNPQQTPLMLLPYLPLDEMFPAGQNMLDSLITNKAFSNAIFTSFFLDANRWRPFVKFTADGTGVMTKKQIKTPESYQIAVKDDLTLGMDLLSCPNGQLSHQGKEYTKKLVELSHIHRFSIVFYRPPINNDLYVLSNTQPARYQYCRSLFNQFMKTLVQENPNIFYRDLSNHPRISQMGLEVYLDTHHVNLRGGKLIAQALDKEIKAALTWGRLNHK